MSYASLEDVASEVGREAPLFASVEGKQWAGWIGRVERAIEAGFRERGLVLADEVAASRVSSVDVVDVVVVRVAARVNAGVAPGLTSSTVTVDDASVTHRREGGESFDPLALTDADWKVLIPAPVVRRARIFSVVPS